MVDSASSPRHQRSKAPVYTHTIMETKCALYLGKMRRPPLNLTRHHSSHSSRHDHPGASGGSEHRARSRSDHTRSRRPPSSHSTCTRSRSRARSQSDQTRSRKKRTASLTTTSSQTDSATGAGGRIRRSHPVDVKAYATITSRSSGHCHSAGKSSKMGSSYRLQPTDSGVVCAQQGDLLQNTDVWGTTSSSVLY
jgi:hypothetical protein